MSCFDYLLRFTDEATAQADPVAGKYYTPTSAGNPGAWRGDVTIPNVSVYTLGIDGVTRTPYVGWFLIISRPALDPALQAIASNGCRLVADRDAATAGKPNFILYTAPDVTPTDLATAHIEPTAMGSNYPFGGGS